MKYYVGIDLGTTNSAICSFDGQNIHILCRVYFKRVNTNL